MWSEMWQFSELTLKNLHPWNKHRPPGNTSLIICFQECLPLQTCSFRDIQYLNKLWRAELRAWLLQKVWGCMAWWTLVHIHHTWAKSILSTQNQISVFDNIAQHVEEYFAGNPMHLIQWGSPITDIRWLHTDVTLIIKKHCSGKPSVWWDLLQNPPLLLKVIHYKLMVFKCCKSKAT